MNYKILLSNALLAICFALPVQAQLSTFVDGPVIKGFGKHANMTDIELDESMQFKVAFDVGKGAEGGEVNRQFDSLARFINMHVAAGVKPEQINLALVVHGRASIDLLISEVYQNVHKTDNPNVPLIKLLMENNVEVTLCGQTAKAYEISEAQLIPGVSVSLSAMTAHARLQQQGFTLNPF